MNLSGTSISTKSSSDKNVSKPIEKEIITSINNIDFNIKIARITTLLYSIIFVLTFISIALQIVLFTTNDYEHLAALFNLDKEENVPTFFASLTLVFASLLFYVIYREKKINEDKYKKNWAILSVLFFLMGADEFLALHEQTSRYLWNIAGGFRFAWIIPGTLFVILFAIYYLKFFLSLDNRWKIRFFAAAAIYLSGTLGMEFLDGLFQMRFGQENLTYSVMTNFEEMLEMIGVVFLIQTLLLYIHSHSQKIIIKVKE